MLNDADYIDWCLQLGLAETTRATITAARSRNRFCEIFEEASTQKMLEVIPPKHAVEMSELLGA